MPVCCSRPEAAPASMNRAAARILAGSGQRARQPIAVMAMPPIRRWT
jgi:hypothetical protein